MNITQYACSNTENRYRHSLRSVIWAMLKISSFCEEALGTLSFRFADSLSVVVCYISRTVVDKQQKFAFRVYFIYHKKILDYP